MSMDALKDAVYRSDLDSVRRIVRDELISYSGDGKGYTPLAIACSRNNVAAATELLKSGFAVDEVFDWTSRTARQMTYRRQFALLYAKSVEMIALLLSHGSDINREDAHGRTILSQSVGNIETFRFLLSRDAIITSRVFEEIDFLRELSEIASRGGKHELASSYMDASNQAECAATKGIKDQRRRQGQAADRLTDRQGQALKSGAKPEPPKSNP